MIQLTGNYFLKVDFGGVEVPLSVDNIREFTIIQDFNKFLPEIRMRINDPQGILTHLVPADNAINKVGIQIGSSISGDEFYHNSFDFVRFRGRPVNENGPSSVFDFTGLLDAEGMFNEDYCRGFDQSIKTTLEYIANNELGVDATEVSPSLNYKAKVIQPKWRNAELFNDLKGILIGKDGGSGFKIFIKVNRGKKVFVCQSFKDLIGQPVKYNFVSGDNDYSDFSPIFSYSIVDNYKMFGMFGAKQQDYTYFDYDNSEFVSANVPVDGFLSLSEFFSIDRDDNQSGVTIQNTGATTDDGLYTPEGKAKANYFNRVGSIVKMWISTVGLPNVCPGDIVKVLFADGQVSGNLQSFQYSGFWMVERVVHSIDKTHRTSLMLTRNGIDTDKKTTLLKATNRKRQ